jgi:anaerobic selenocysteine-containing dehydrogenase
LRAAEAAPGTKARRTEAAARPSDRGAAIPEANAADQLLMVPVPRLFDAGTMIAPSHVLRPLVAEPHVIMSPFDAAPRGLTDGTRVRIEAPGGEVECVVRVREGVTPGTVLAPESLDWAIPIEGMLRGRRPVAVSVAAAAS